jgi:hypothetical protein
MPWRPRPPTSTKPPRPRSSRPCSIHGSTPRISTRWTVLDVSGVREEWDALIAEMRSDPNKGHFKRNEDWDEIDIDALPDELRREFIDFLVSSLTAEFSGCVLYKEMKRRGKNKDICELFGLMSRDESRHAGFINDALKEFSGSASTWAFSPRRRNTPTSGRSSSTTRPICRKRSAMPATSRSTGIWSKHPEQALPPDLQVVQEWCNDEFRHGEAFALIMRSDPKLISGSNMSTGSSSSCWRCSPRCMCATMPVRRSTRRSTSASRTYDMKVFHPDQRDHQAGVPDHARS